MSKLKNRTLNKDLDNYPKDFSPCHRRVLSARGISFNDISKPLSKLINVNLLTGAKDAAYIIYKEIQRGGKIIIVGDYDADGVTSISVMVSVFQYLGANFDYIIPNRITMGYGLSLEIAKQVIDKNANLVITVDNGISAVDGINEIVDKDIDVIVTDHHLPPDILPNATVIVNPNNKNCSFPSKSMAGVGVAFYVMLALRQVYSEHGNNKFDYFSISDLLPLVAIGTIADVVTLDFNNRILVEQGLKRIRLGNCSAGILEIILSTGLSLEEISSKDISFHVAPRLNAAGRIADMSLGVDCLLATNKILAKDYALELDRLNRERKSIENEMKIQADNELLKNSKHYDDVSCICLYDNNWNEGIIGILASRLKDKYNKTAFVFTDSGIKKDIIKGSVRAAKGIDIISALDLINAKSANLIDNYGGHAKAAGISLNINNYNIFVNEIENIIKKQQDKIVIDDNIYTDGELLPYELSLENARFLKVLEPWGQGIDEPLFENTFYINDIREVGKNHAQLQMLELSSNMIIKGIAFDKFAYYYGFYNKKCRVAYKLSINEWKNKESLNLLVTHIELV